MFFGDASDAMADVYARLPQRGRAAGLTLGGSLIGPNCLYADTLPATFAFVDRGPATSLVAEAIVPEPCFWTPEMPHLYRATSSCAGGQVLATRRARFRHPPLGACGRQADLRRQALGACAAVLIATKSRPANWTPGAKPNTAMVVRNPDDALCQQASRVGVLLVAELTEPDAGEIRRLGTLAGGGHRRAAERTVELPLLGDWAHNLILAQRIRSPASRCARPWADSRWSRRRDPADVAARVAGMSACRSSSFGPAGRLDSVAAGRAACDRLQRDLAGQGDWPGYIV